MSKYKDASTYKDIVKNGWHPEKSSSSSGSERKGIRGSVKGLVGRGSGSSNDNSNHVARPLTDLRDPASFAPPPKRTGTGLAAPPPVPDEKNKPVRSVVASPSKYQDPRAAAPSPPPQKMSHAPGQLGYQEEAEEEAAQKPRGPFQSDTTGLSTNHLPPPPGRRDGANQRIGPNAISSTTTGNTSRPSPPPPTYETALTHSQQKPAGPSLPPRLPARTNTGSTAASSPTSPAQPPALLNQSAVNRLGAAGVSVPGFGIGKPSEATATSTPSPPPPPRQVPTPPARGASAQANELQNRFSRLSTAATSSSPSQSATGSGGVGTTWAQKQAALRTAGSFQKDPSSVSIADARAAATTANDFRQRHGDQVAAGVKSANGLNQKYGIANKIGELRGDTQPPQQQGIVAAGTSPSPVAAIAGKKKPPPPPPAKKKPGLGGAPVSSPGTSNGADEPPPIPMATRPTF